MDLTDLLPRSDDDKFLCFRDSERLEKFKPIIVQLYMEVYGPGGKRMTLRQITEFMKDKYAFHIAGNQLEYILRKWNVRRRILSHEKDAVINALGKRARTGATIADATLQEGKPVDAKQLKRHVRDKIRRHVVEPMAPGVLSAWNLPYSAFIRATVGMIDELSPFEDKSVAPNCIKSNSSEDPATVPSQPMQLIRQKWIQDQSNLLLQGRFRELFLNCESEDRKALVNYLYDFWIHTFVTAKHWTMQNSQLWTKDMISTGIITSLTAPNLTSGSLAERHTPSASASHDESPLRPAQYCRWVVHISNEETVFNPPQHFPPSSEPHQDFQSFIHFDVDPLAPTVWPPEDQTDHLFTKLMQEFLDESAFTSLPLDSLPISGSLISESLIKDSRSLQLESLKFAIIAGNLELVESILKEGQRIHEQLLEIHPYHLAATYLDGGNTCCLLLATLTNHLGGRYPLARNNEDSMGHTVFDCLVISVLRSHTNVVPEDVDSRFANMKRYSGEEKDTCGRWDADSPIVQQLFQRGNCRIPFSWKHPFCHSAVQAVCHNLMTIFLPGSYNPHIHQSSGLFIRRCENCGATLTLGTLHLAIVLAYYLAASGANGETLFGAVAVLVCLLRLGANVFQKTEVSIHEILGDSSDDACQHNFMDPEMFIQTFPLYALNLLKPECRIAWGCMRGILRLAKAGRILRRNESSTSNTEIRNNADTSTQFASMNMKNEECVDPKETLKNEDVEEDILYEPDRPECPLKREHGRWQFPCGNSQLGLVWAVAQAEMLTYRRKLDTKPWISENFSMVALKEWLEGELGKLEMPLVQKDMIRETTPCGWISNQNFPFSTAKCVTKQLDIDMETHS